MDVLFIHQNFPGQYPHLAAALKARGDRIMAIGGSTARPLAGIPLHRYDPLPPGGVPACHRWASDFQTKCLRAEAIGTLLEGLIREGLSPDLVIGHPGWGELLGIKDLLPGVPVLHQVELVYQLDGGDLGFDPEFEAVGWREQLRVRLRRAHQLLAFHDLDWGVSPTLWQASTVPAKFRERVSVIHEGIDTDAIGPRPDAEVGLQKAGHRFRPGDEVVTFVARQLEPYRGFHSFMRMLPHLQRLRPRVHVLLVGGDGVSYGSAPPGGGTWRQRLLKELEGQLDMARIHFVGRVPHATLHNLFRISACHVYLTVPFVLSWSLLEAMACGTVVVGSNTPPVAEVIHHGRNGLLVDFFDTVAMAEAVAAVLADPVAHQPLGDAARSTVIERFDLKRVCLPRLVNLADAVAARDFECLRAQSKTSPCE